MKTGYVYARWQNQPFIKSTFFFIKRWNRFSFTGYEIYLIELQVIIEFLVWLGHRPKIDSMSCEFYSYISSLAKLFNIENRIRSFIFNIIISEKECFTITKLLHSFLFFTIVYKSGQVFNMSFSSGYIKIVIGWFHLSFAKNVSSLKDFSKTINNVFIPNNFDIPA